MQIWMLRILVLFDVGGIVNQVLGDGQEAFDVVELKAGIQQLGSMMDAILVIPEAKPHVKVAELDHKETIGGYDVP